MVALKESHQLSWKQESGIHFAPAAPRHSHSLGWLNQPARVSVRMEVHAETQGFALNPRTTLCLLPLGQEVTAQREP